MLIYTKLNLWQDTVALIKNQMDMQGLEWHVGRLPQNCDCKSLEDHELHITINPTDATSISYIYQAYQAEPNPNDREVQRLNLDDRLEWNQIYTDFQKEMPKKLCETLGYILQNVELKVADFSAGYGRFAVIELEVIDNAGERHYFNPNTHISTIKCKGDQARECLVKLDRMGQDGSYRSIIHLDNLRDQQIHVNGISTYGNAYGENHLPLISRNLVECQNQYPSSNNVSSFTNIREEIDEVYDDYDFNPYDYDFNPDIELSALNDGFFSY